LWVLKFPSTCESDTKRIFRTCQGVFYTKSSILSQEFWIT
jgi:hypothetical protein